MKNPADINSYNLVSVINRSSTEIRYHAIEKRSGLNVIVEMALVKHFSEPRQIYEFYNRARDVTALDHAQIYKPQAFGVTNNNYPFLIWDIVQADDLWELLEKTISLDQLFICNTFRSVCEALGLAISAGMIHDVIYPSDLLFLHKESLPVIGGFGRLLLMPDRDSESLSAVDISPYYKAPELCLGEDPSELSEIYALGTLMYESLVQQPYEISAEFKRSVVGRTCYECIGWLETLPQKTINFPASFTKDHTVVNLQPIIQRCLQLNPSRRFSDLADLRGELLSAFGD